MWALSLEGDRKLKLLIPKPAAGFGGRSVFSPDGQWLAYQSNRSTGAVGQIYVQPFPPTGAQFQITHAGGNLYPLWSPDGKQIFYLTAGRGGAAAGINAVDVHTKPTVVSGEAVLLPLERIPFGQLNRGRNYDISPAGKQFIVLLPPDQVQSGDPAPVRINIVVNWFSELKNHIPVK